MHVKKKEIFIKTLIIALVALITDVRTDTHLDINDASLLESFGPNTYVVDLSKNDNLNRAFILTCSSGPNVLDLNLTFTGLRSRIEKIPIEKLNTPGPKTVQLALNTPLMTEYTGRYNCTARYPNDLIETVSWYVYFYPADGTLFQQCPLMIDQKPKCLVFYRSNVPFRVPCKALHPKVVVSDHGNFEYNPEVGFTGRLAADKRNFECKGSFQGFEDEQKYELNRKSYTSKVFILAPNGISFVSTSLKEESMRITKGQSLNLTCMASVGCNDINYDLFFNTNSTDPYQVVMNIPDRSKCLLNFNEITNFSKTIVFKSFNTNGSRIQCDIRFGPELKTESPAYFVYFADEQFLRYDPKTVFTVDYHGVTESVSYLLMEINFEASNDFDITIHFEDELIGTIDDSNQQKNKYEFSCLSIGVFQHKCIFHIDPYTKSDTGEYSAKIALKSNPDIRIQLNITAIMPKSPETALIQPKFCSQNWTCELGKKPFIQCNANAHRVAQLSINFEECNSIEHCYSLRTNQQYIENLISQLQLQSLQTPQAILEQKPSVIEKIGTARISMADGSDFDAQEDELNSQSVVNQIEPGDDGVTWLTKRDIQIKKFYLVFCYAENEKGSDYSTKIIKPSDLERGKPFQVDTFNKERPQDKEIVVGDSFKLIYSFNNILYSSDKYNLISKPQTASCEINNADFVLKNWKNYTRTLEIPFENVQLSCSSNYSLELKIINEKYFLDPKVQHGPKVLTNPVVVYNLNVVNFIVPYFLNSAEKQTEITNSTDELTNGGNVTEIFIAYSGDIKVDSDKTVELNCQSRGKPKPDVRWLKDGQLLNITEEKYKYDETGSLKILRTHPVDSGAYQCNVSNRYGFIKRSFIVDVESPIKAITEMSRKQVILIVVITVITFILLVLLLMAILFVVHQKRENSKLIKKHKKLLEFLTGESDDMNDLESLGLLNTKIENLQKLKFDDQKWEIEATNFVIHYNKVLGSGNFGKVCMATVSSVQLRDEDQVNIDLASAGGSNKLIGRLSMKRTHNTYVDGVLRKKATNKNDHSDVEVDEIEPLMTNDKTKKLVAAKMVKDLNSNSSNVDSLLQELKIMGYIGHHVNIIQLIGCFTSKLISDGYVFVFVELCPYGDLKNWLKEHHENYVKTNDAKSSMFNQLSNRLKRPITANFRITKNISLEDSLKAADFNPNNLTFNDSDLTFFGYQIAKGMEFLAKKRFIHRDLAARNVLLSSNFECKISDFGLADESKLTGQTYFGKVNTGMPVKWTAPEALLELKYVANSDVWSFGIVLWEIFSLCQSDPYKWVPNKEFRDYLAKIKNGDESTELPENGSNEIHDIMQLCWRIDPKIRPTFQELVPKLEALLSENHKKYYGLLSKLFQEQFVETNKIFRRDLNQRDSKPNVQSQQPPVPTSPTHLQSSTPAKNTPEYFKIPIQINPNSTGYLQPQLPSNSSNNYNQSIQSSYLEPSNKPFQKNEPTKNIPINNGSGYLQPASNNSQNENLEDSYGGSNIESGYVSAQNKQDTYMNEDFINELKKRPPQFAEQEDDRISDSYLIPRIGSNTSRASSTAPLMPRSGKNVYAPSPPLPQGKLSQFKPTKTNETDV